LSDQVRLRFIHIEICCMIKGFACMVAVAQILVVNTKAN